ncbi:hypothetical protein AAC387_Pa03g1186 [Persea americana]
MAELVRCLGFDQVGGIELCRDQGFLAEVLAQFKPKPDVGTLILHLSHVEQMIMDSLHYFNSTRHMILYYEDIVSNRKKLS